MTYPPQQPPPVMPGQPAKRRAVRILAWVVAGIAAFSLGAVAKIAWRTFRPDSGVQACEQLRDNPVANSGKQFTEQRYRELRQKFAGSRDENLRIQGTKMVDLAWQIAPNPNNAAAYMGPLIQAASGVQSACADHGIVLPSS